MWNNNFLPFLQKYVFLQLISSSRVQNIFLNHDWTRTIEDGNRWDLWGKKRYKTNLSISFVSPLLEINHVDII